MTRLLPFVLVLLSGAIFYWYINPTYTQGIMQSQQKIASYERALKAAESYTSRETELIAERNQIPAESLSRVQTFLPDDVDNVQLILDLSSLAARSGVTVSGFAISKTPGAAAADAVPAINGSQPGLSSAVGSSNLTDSLDVSVTVAGSYDGFYNFLTQTEKSLRLLDVTNLTVSSAANGLYTYNVTFRLYWLH